LGEDLAAEIVKNLDENELRKLGGSMSRVFSLAPEVFNSVFEEFHQLAASPQSLALNPGQRSTFMRNVFSKAIRGEKAQALIDEIQKQGRENLFQKLGEVNQAKKLVRRLPTLAEVQRWVDQAKKLPGAITY
jgi:flagellar motor switch protein FliG